MEDKDGKRHREGPLNESEESLINEQWKVCWRIPLSVSWC